MRIAIVDDDAQMYALLHSLFRELLGSNADLTYFSGGEVFLRKWRSEAFDLIILDIFMDRLTGMEVAREIRRTDRSVKIAFCTTSNEYASESYEVNACYYLHKPFGKEHVKALLDRIDRENWNQKRTVTLPDGKPIVLRHILYADYASHCVTLHCRPGPNRLVRAKFSEIAALLGTYPYFFSPTKGVILNFHEVSEQNRDTFRMSDGSLIPISRRRARDVSEAYSSFLFETLRKGGEP